MVLHVLNSSKRLRLFTVVQYSSETMQLCMVLQYSLETMKGCMLLPTVQFIDNAILYAPTVPGPWMNQIGLADFFTRMLRIFFTSPRFIKVTTTTFDRYKPQYLICWENSQNTLIARGRFCRKWNQVSVYIMLCVYTVWKVISSNWWCQNISLSITDMFVIDHKEKKSLINCCIHKQKESSGGVSTVYFTISIWKTTKTMYTCNHSQEISNVCDTSLWLSSLLSDWLQFLTSFLSSRQASVSLTL